ncbi:hypothetical protein SCHPADRAFT_598437 [Schizopora paradoxa]|uniref:Uncharacterized protein n=1 Tax=Schizopora paradoxa TaxID=27342 RepID=A0A0H2RV80_9AGAM|nr:hypothetical protein SCHPADRAFT_598437 [Schizopora paradoxa]
MRRKYSSFWMTLVPALNSSCSFMATLPPQERTTMNVEEPTISIQDEESRKEIRWWKQMRRRRRRYREAILFTSFIASFRRQIHAITHTGLESTIFITSPPILVRCPFLVILMD